MKKVNLINGKLLQEIISNSTKEIIITPVPHIHLKENGLDKCYITETPSGYDILETFIDRINKDNTISKAYIYMIMSGKDYKDYLRKTQPQPLSNAFQRYLNFYNPEWIYIRYLAI